MSSHRHNKSVDVDRPGGDDALLDAARDRILAVGWKRTTLTDVARRAGVSRMTMYRRWPDMQTLLADLMTREWAGVVEEPALRASDTSPRARLAEGVSVAVGTLRENPLFRRIVEVDPELLLPYLLDRRGRTQDTILVLVEAAVTEGQATGDVRAGDPGLLARSVLLAAHGFALSAHTMLDAEVGPTALDGELRVLVDRFLAP